MNIHGPGGWRRWGPPRPHRILLMMPPTMLFTFSTKLWGGIAGIAYVMLVGIMVWRKEHTDRKVK